MVDDAGDAGDAQASLDFAGEQRHSHGVTRGQHQTEGADSRQRGGRRRGWRRCGRSLLDGWLLWLMERVEGGRKCRRVERRRASEGAVAGLAAGRGLSAVRVTSVAHSPGANRIAHTTVTSINPNRGISGIKWH